MKNKGLVIAVIAVIHDECISVRHQCNSNTVRCMDARRNFCKGCKPEKCPPHGEKRPNMVKRKPSHGRKAPHKEKKGTSHCEELFTRLSRGRANAYYCPPPPCESRSSQVMYQIHVKSVKLLII